SEAALAVAARASQTTHLIQRPVRGLEPRVEAVLHFVEPGVGHHLRGAAALDEGLRRVEAARDILQKQGLSPDIGLLAVALDLAGPARLRAHRKGTKPARALRERDPDE